MYWLDQEYKWIWGNTAPLNQTLMCYDSSEVIVLTWIKWFLTFYKLPSHEPFMLTWVFFYYLNFIVADGYALSDKETGEIYKNYPISADLAEAFVRYKVPVDEDFNSLPR